MINAFCCRNNNSLRRRVDIREMVNAELEHVHGTIPYGIHSVVFDLLTHLRYVLALDGFLAPVVVELSDGIHAAVVDHQPRFLEGRPELVSLTHLLELQEALDNIDPFAPVDLCQRVDMTRNPHLA